MKNLVFFSILYLSIIIGYSNKKKSNNFIYTQFHSSKFDTKNTLNDIFKIGIAIPTINNQITSIYYCKSVLNKVIFVEKILIITNFNRIMMPGSILLGYNLLTEAMNHSVTEIFDATSIKNFTTTNYYFEINNYSDCQPKFLKTKYQSVIPTQIFLSKEIIQNQSFSNTIIFCLLLVIISMGLGIIFLLVRNHKKNKKIHSLSVIHFQNELLKKDFEKLELTENLKETAEELNTSIVNIKKVALLKKQLENIVDETNPNFNEKETLKKLKLCLNSFFDNYRELTQIMQKKLNVDKIVDLIKKDHPEITEKEIKVIEYIVLHFTTKEIALLMDKSEKSVEYYRTQIRKKIKLNSSNTLEEYLNFQIRK